jgi:hypothetical protein
LWIPFNLMNDAVSAARRKANAIKWVTIRVSTEGTIVTMQISDDGRIAGLRPIRFVRNAIAAGALASTQLRSCHRR